MDIPYIILTNYGAFMGVEAREKSNTRQKLVRKHKEDPSGYLKLQLLLTDSVVAIRLPPPNIEKTEESKKLLDNVYEDAKKRGYLDGWVKR